MAPGCVPAPSRPCINGNEGLRILIVSRTAASKVKGLSRYAFITGIEAVPRRGRPPKAGGMPCQDGIQAGPRGSTPTSKTVALLLTRGGQVIYTEGLGIPLGKVRAMGGVTGTLPASVFEKKIKVVGVVSGRHAPCVTCAYTVLTMQGTEAPFVEIR